MRSDPDWGRHCGDQWKEHVLATTGRDVCNVIGPLPRRPREMAAMMRRLGVRDLAGIVSTVHGPSVPSRQARRGDVVRLGWSLGVCRGDRAEFWGSVMLPMKEVSEAWSVCGKALLDQSADSFRTGGNTVLLGPPIVNAIQKGAGGGEYKPGCVDHGCHTDISYITFFVDATDASDISDAERRETTTVPAAPDHHRP